MTTSDTTQHPGQPAGRDEAGLDRFFDWLRSLDVRRDTDEKWLAGVCSGLATRLGVDPIVVRAGLVLLVLLGGLGITVYLVAWAFIPNESEEILAERAVRQGEVMPIILLVVIGLSLFGGTGFAHDNGGFVWFWWLVLTVGVVVWLVTRHRGGRTTPLTAGHQPATAGYGSSAPTTMAGAGTIPTAPGTTAPGTTAPGTTAPGTTAPGTTAPGTTAPGTTAPGTTAFSTAAFGTTAPGVAVTASPGSPVPPVPPAPTMSRRPPRPPRPPRAPRRRSAGFLGAVLVSGVALAAYGLTLWAHEQNHWAGSGDTVALAVALAVVGAAVLVMGVVGRRAGLTGFIAIVLTLTTWTASVVPNLSFGGGVGDRLWRPSAADTTGRYRLGIGTGELDLTAVPNAEQQRRIDAGIGIGELRIRIPQNLTVEVRSSVGAGDISQVAAGALPASPSAEVDQPDLFGSGSSSQRGGRDISTTETFGTGSPDVVVTAHVGLGQILIGKE